MQIYNQIRALQPWPATFTSFREKKCLIWGRPLTADAAPSAAPGTIRAEKSEVIVACGTGSLRLDEVQLEGRKRVTPQEFANGARLAPGERFV